MQKIHQLAAMLLFFTATAFQAYGQDFAKVDSIVKKYPKAFTSVDRLAGRINKDFTTEEEKARAIFIWIAHNIKYDTAEYLKIKDITTYRELTDEKYALKTLVERKGVCSAYATLYKVLAAKTGLETVVVSGYARNNVDEIGFVPDETDHAWNAVKIGGEWKLLDATWASGEMSFEGNTVFRLEDAYFFTDPDVFSLNHFPEDTQWLFTDRTKEEYRNLPFFYNLRYQVVSPLQGILKKSDGEVTFTIKNTKEDDWISYAFDDNLPSDVSAETGDGFVKFSIPMRDAIGILYIYVSGESIAAYKIEK